MRWLLDDRIIEAGRCSLTKKLCSILGNLKLLPSLKLDMYPKAVVWEVQPNYKSVLKSPESQFVVNPGVGYVSSELSWEVQPNVWVPKVMHR